MRHTASTRHDLTAKLVEQLLRRPQPRSDAEPTCGEATTWWRTQKAQARDRVPEPGPSIGGAAGNRTRFGVLVSEPNGR